MSKIDRLAQVYRQHIGVPWVEGLSSVQRVIFAVYEPQEELRLRANAAEFELATKAAGHDWQLIDLTQAFPEWMLQQEYRDSYFESPEDLTGYQNGDLTEFSAHLIRQVRDLLTSGNTPNTVTALLGVGSLFGLTRVSKLVEGVADTIQGRLLVFFPGEYADHNYRLLDARDGWNYMAVPLQAQDA